MHFLQVVFRGSILLYLRILFFCSVFIFGHFLSHYLKTFLSYSESSRKYLFSFSHYLCLVFFFEDLPLSLFFSCTPLFGRLFFYIQLSVSGMLFFQKTPFLTPFSYFFWCCLIFSVKFFGISVLRPHFLFSKRKHIFHCGDLFSLLSPLFISEHFFLLSSYLGFRISISKGFPLFYDYFSSWDTLFFYSSLFQSKFYLKYMFFSGKSHYHIILSYLSLLFQYFFC